MAVAASAVAPACRHRGALASRETAGEREVCGEEHTRQGSPAPARMSLGRRPGGFLGEPALDHAAHVDARGVILDIHQTRDGGFSLRLFHGLTPETETRRATFNGGRPGGSL